MYQTLESNKSPELEDQSENIVINIDHDSKAVSQSSALCKKLGQRAKGMQFICQEAESLGPELQASDVVFLAALVGTTQEEKEVVLTSIVAKMRVGSLLVIRTAHSLRTLLYPVSFECVGHNRVLMTLKENC
jgi:nicotianamine synthase